MTEIEKLELKIAECEKSGYTSEDAMLSHFMTWAKNKYPQLRKSIFHIENEGVKTGMQGAQSLAKGKLAGVPDVCSVYMGRVEWAEFKRPGQKLSPAQKELHPHWAAMGIRIHMVYTFQEWNEFIKLVLL